MPVSDVVYTHYLSRLSRSRADCLLLSLIIHSHFPLQPIFGHTYLMLESLPRRPIVAIDRQTFGELTLMNKTGAGQARRAGRCLHLYRCSFEYAG